MDGEDPDVTELLADLTLELRRLQREADPTRGSGLSTSQKLSLFTSEVAIPGVILLLKTQIRALELLRRAIRIADGRDPDLHTGAVSEVRTRAERLGQTTLAQLDYVLEELQTAFEGSPQDDRVRDIISEARHLQRQISDELGNTSVDGESVDTVEPADSIDIDVESELRTLKRNLEDEENGHSDGSPPASIESPNDGTESDGGSKGPGDDGNESGEGNNGPGDDGNESGEGNNGPGDDGNESGEGNNRPGDDGNESGEGNNRPGVDGNDPGDDN